MRDFIFDAVLYAVKIVAIFYKVQYEHIISDVKGCVYVCFKFPGGMLLPRTGKIG